MSWSVEMNVWVMRWRRWGVGGEGETDNYSVGRVANSIMEFSWEHSKTVVAFFFSSCVFWLPWSFYADMQFELWSLTYTSVCAFFQSCVWGGLCTSFRTHKDNKSKKNACMYFGMQLWLFKIYCHLFIYDFTLSGNFEIRKNSLNQRKMNKYNSWSLLEGEVSSARQIFDQCYWHRCTPFAQLSGCAAVRWV